MRKLNTVAAAGAALAAAALLGAGPAAAAPSSPAARPPGHYAVIANHTDSPRQIYITRLHDDASGQLSQAGHTLPRTRTVSGGEWHFNHPHPRLGKPH